MKSILVLFAFLFASSAFAADSAYTSIDRSDCRTIYDSSLQKEPEIDAYEGICPGLDGYKVKISGGDLRYSLSLISGGRTINLTQLTSFHDLGATQIEWRGTNGAYNALIYRLNIANEEGKDTSYLYVVRLAGRASCVVAKIGPGPGQNQRARDFADSGRSRCI